MLNYDEMRSQRTMHDPSIHARSAADLLRRLAEKYIKAVPCKAEIDKVEQIVRTMNIDTFYAMIAYCLLSASKTITDQLNKATESN